MATEVDRVPNENRGRILDVIFSSIVSLIVGGLTGYFGGILAMKDDISSISNRVASIEANRDGDWKRKFDDVDRIDKETKQSADLLKMLNSSREAQIILQALLTQSIEDMKRETATQIRTIVEEINKKNE